MAEVEIQEARLNLPELVERALSGERVVLTRDGEPTVRLVPVPSEGFRSLVGVWEGQVGIAEDFDELPDDLAEAFGMLP